MSSISSLDSCKIFCLPIQLYDIMHQKHFSAFRYSPVTSNVSFQAPTPTSWFLCQHMSWGILGWGHTNEILNIYKHEICHDIYGNLIELIILSSWYNLFGIFTGCVVTIPLSFILVPPCFPVIHFEMGLVMFPGRSSLPEKKLYLRISPSPVWVSEWWSYISPVPPNSDMNMIMPCAASYYSTCEHMTTWYLCTTFSYWLGKIKYLCYVLIQQCYMSITSSTLVWGYHSLPLCQYHHMNSNYHFAFKV